MRYEWLANLQDHNKYKNDEIRKVLTDKRRELEKQGRWTNVMTIVDEDRMVNMAWQGSNGKEIQQSHHPFYILLVAFEQVFEFLDQLNFYFLIK